jgi:hypothetical protein
MTEIGIKTIAIALAVVATVWACSAFICHQ